MIVLKVGLRHSHFPYSKSILMKSIVIIGQPYFRLELTRYIFFKLPGRHSICYFNGEYGTVSKFNVCHCAEVENEKTGQIKIGILRH